MKNKMDQWNLKCCRDSSVDLEKCSKMTPQAQKSALIQPRKSRGKGGKNVCPNSSKGPRWLYTEVSRQFQLDFLHALQVVQPLLPVCPKYMESAMKPRSRSPSVYSRSTSPAGSPVPSLVSSSQSGSRESSPGAGSVSSRVSWGGAEHFDN